MRYWQSAILALAFGPAACAHGAELGMQRAHASRLAHGAFRSVADLSRRAKLGAAEGRALQAMAAAAKADGPYFRQ